MLILPSFFFIINTPTKYASLFDPDKHFQPSLSFVNKARAHPSGVPYSASQDWSVYLDLLRKSIIDDEESVWAFPFI